MTEQLLDRALAGGDEAFQALVQPHLRELHVHCYRLLGSVQDAEDVLQETLLAAWRGLAGLERREALRGWLYRIATNRCLNALRAGNRRSKTLPALERPLPEPSRRVEPSWLEPYPDAFLEGLPDDAPGPESTYERREAISLAFIAAMQTLPPRQRAVLVLRDVLGYRAAEAASTLDISEHAANSALKRARAALGSRLPGRDAPLPDERRERELSRRFAAALEGGDVPALVELLTDDAWLRMPPQPEEYLGSAAVGAFFGDFALAGGRRHRLFPTRANGQPAFGVYATDPGRAPGRPHGVLVLTLSTNRISGLTRFGPENLAMFGMRPR